MVYSKIDQFYRSLLLSKFFTKGWGKPENLKRLFEFRKIISNRESCQALVEKDHPILIDKDYKDGDCRILEGHFKSPFVNHLPGIMPKEVETASFQAVLPNQWTHPTLKPICIHLAGTGDHFYWRRRLFTARPLLKEYGIASILLENPFYGSRKPKSQIRSSLHNVSDLFVMGGALILESLALLHWCQRQGWGPFGISGISMGGHNACAAATVCPTPISVVPLLSWTTASTSLTKGVMSEAIPWHVLQEQFFKNNLYHDEISKLIVSPEKAYRMGQEFVINYSRDMERAQAEKSKQLFSVQDANFVSSSNKIERSKDATELVQDNSNPHSKENINLNSSHSPEKSERKVLQAESSSSNPLSSSSLSSSLDEAAQSLDAAASAIVGTKLNVSLNESSDSVFSQNKLDINQKAKTTRDDIRRLSLNYAQTKTLQQSLDVKSKEEKKRLTLGHAVAKSKILFSHKTSDEKRDELIRKKNLKDESYEFMRGVMDECTHLGNFSVPVDPELVIIVSATQDAYIPREGVVPLDKLWPGCEVRSVDQGHVGAVVLHQKVFRQAVKDAFDKQIKKYYPDHYLETKRSPMGLKKQTRR